MSNGCLSPNAVNYASSATGEDFSCKYLIKHNSICHLFEDVLTSEVIDKSFTLSYSVKGQSWVFFHDYIPDLYMHTREKLYSIKSNKTYQHNNGNPGNYYGTTKSFFIDIIVRGEGDMLLEDVSWVTEFLSSNTDQRFSTLSHIAIWNSTQHTGRISLQQVFDKLTYNNIRRTKGEWGFDDFKDILIDNAGTFLGTMFSNYALDGTKVDPSPVWYNQKDMEDSWFCIRFEFDNTVSAQVILHDTSIQALKSDR